MAKRSIDGKFILVTGASSGIGRALAKVLSSKGARLLVTARREERLLELVDEIEQMGGEAWAVPGDLTDPLDRERMIKAAQEKGGGLDGLINNAGAGASGFFAKADPARLRSIMELNFFAPVELTRTALPLLSAKPNSIIVNVSSVLAHRAIPNNLEYCASKFAMHGFSDSLRAELANENIDLLHVCPSTTETEFFDKMERGITESGRAKVRLTPSPALWVAQKTVRAMERGKHEIILTRSAKWIVAIDRLLPTLANRIVARWG